jgi:hypothetical protein
MKFKMAATAGLCLTLDPMGKMFQSASSLKPLGQLKPNCLGSINAIASEKKIFLYFPIWSCVNTMTCGGSHLGFRIGIKNPNFLRGPSNDYSWAVWFQLSKLWENVQMPSSQKLQISLKPNYINVHWMVLYKL